MIVADSTESSSLGYKSYEKFEKTVLINAQSKAWASWKNLEKVNEDNFNVIANELVRVGNFKNENNETLEKTMTEVGHNKVLIQLYKDEYFKITRLLNKLREKKC